MSCVQGAGFDGFVSDGADFEDGAGLQGESIEFHQGGVDLILFFMPWLRLAAVCKIPLRGANVEYVRPWTRLLPPSRCKSTVVTTVTGPV